MNDLRNWLKDGDPVVSESPLSDVDVERMRRAILTAAESPVPSRPLWARTPWAAASVVVAVTIAIGTSRWFGPIAHIDRPRSAGTAVPALPVESHRGAGTSVPTVPRVDTTEGRRQVHFLAPGGTRVIWVFNADFKP